MTRWSSLDAAARRALEARFAEAELADAWSEAAAGPPAGPGFADLFAWATDPAARFGAAERAMLLRDPALRRSFALLLERLAQVHVPAAAAAASGDIERRAATGLEVRLLPSRADPAQTYVIVAFDPASAPTALLVLQDGLPLARLALAEASDGRLQVIEASDGELVAALRDPTTELLLV